MRKSKYCKQILAGSARHNGTQRDDKKEVLLDFENILKNGLVWLETYNSNS